MKNAHGFYVEPWLIYNVNQVKQQLTNQPARFANEIDDMRKRVAEAIDYQWADSFHYMWSPLHRHLISFAVYNNNNGISFNVWTTNSEAIGNCRSDAATGEIWAEQVQKVFARIALIDEGKAHCSDCQEIMVMSEKGGRYFGGIYCQGCWDGKWKAIEAKETYN